MKKLFCIVIAFLSLFGFLSAQNIPVHIKVVGSDGKPLLKSMVELFDYENENFTEITAGKDGQYNLVLVNKCSALRISGINHQSTNLPIVIHNAKELDFTIQLPTLSYTNDFSKVKLIGNFNKWDRDNAIPLKLNEKGIYYAEIEVGNDTVEYQLIGISKISETHSVNGTMSDDYKYDNGGDFKSVIYKKGKTAHIEFDPSKLIAQNKECLLFANKEDSDEIRMLKEKITYSNNIFRMQNEMAVDPKKKPDFSETINELKKKAHTENNEYMKGYYSISYLDYWPYIDRFQMDTIICQKIIEVVPPESELWILNPNLLSVATMGFKNNKNVLLEYYKKVADKHANASVKAEVLRTLIYEANKKGDTQSFNNYIQRIVKECPNARPTKDIISKFLTLAAGNDVPDFELSSLSDNKVKYSNKSLLGKFYIIDFWATWCGPCIAEQPTLHEAYKEFRDRNFEILSISLDAKKELVQKFRKEKFEMPWLHTLLENGFSNELAKKFGVTGVPKVVLVSDKGKILACDSGLRGEELKSTLKKYIIPDLDQKQN